MAGVCNLGFVQLFIHSSNQKTSLWEEERQNERRNDPAHHVTFGDTTVDGFGWNPGLFRAFAGQSWEEIYSEFCVEIYKVVLIKWSLE